jgi:hypothetical protein
MDAIRGTVIGVAAIAMLGGLAAARAEPRAVVELFTSQGCSSCPPADRLLGELQDDPALIAMSLPVHYWDYLGWKDTLADPRHTARQKAYSLSRGDGDVYTPQIVVNGLVQALGSDKAAVKKALEAAGQRDATLSVPLELSVTNEAIVVSAPEGDRGLSGEVWLLGLARSVPVAIRRGENNGRTITYSNVVRHWLKVADWPGDARRWTIPVSDIRVEMVDAVVAIVQSGSADKPGAILGAGYALLK